MTWLVTYAQRQLKKTSFSVEKNWQGWHFKGLVLEFKQFLSWWLNSSMLFYIWVFRNFIKSNKNIKIFEFSKFIQNRLGRSKQTKLFFLIEMKKNSSKLWLTFKYAHKEFHEKCFSLFILFTKFKKSRDKLNSFKVPTGTSTSFMTIIFFLFNFLIF